MFYTEDILDSQWRMNNVSSLQLKPRKPLPTHPVFPLDKDDIYTQGLIGRTLHSVTLR